MFDNGRLVDMQNEINKLWFTVSSLNRSNKILKAQVRHLECLVEEMQMQNKARYIVDEVNKVARATKRYTYAKRPRHINEIKDEK